MGNNMFKFQIHSIQWKDSTQVTKYCMILSNDILEKEKPSIKHTGLIVTVNHEEADLKKSTHNIENVYALLVVTLLYVSASPNGWVVLSQG